MLLKDSAPPDIGLQSVVATGTATPPWKERLSELQADPAYNSAGLIKQMREIAGEHLRSDERMEGMLYAWGTGEAEPSWYYRRLLDRVSLAEPGRTAANGDLPPTGTPSLIGSSAGQDQMVLSPETPQVSDLPWSKQLRALRRQQGMTKADLVAELRAHAPQAITSDDEALFWKVVTWERGKDVPSPFYRDLLSDVLKAPSDTLVLPAQETKCPGDSHEPASKLCPPWAERVKTLRSEQGVSRADLVEALRDKAQTPLCSDEELYNRVAGWESGAYWPSNYFCDLLSEVFQVPATEFVNPTATADQLDNPGLDGDFYPGPVLCTEDSDDADGWD